MSGPMIDSTLVAAPSSATPNVTLASSLQWVEFSEHEKAALSEGKSAADIWPDTPAKAREKDISVLSTGQSGKARMLEDATVLHDVAIPSLGSKAPASIDCRQRVIGRRVRRDRQRHP
ncbi:MAG: hypothetical protein AAF713_12380 [Pseudomonadota bacterium]